MPRKKKSNKALPITLIVIAGIILFVVAILLVFRVTQVMFSHKVNSITFTSDSGPVSPEFQQSQILALTSGSCQLTVTKFSPESTSSTPCNMTSDKYQKIVDSMNTYDVIDKVQAAEDSTTQQSLGGKRQSISIQLQDGTAMTAEMTPQLKDSLQPFLDDVTLYVPQMSQLQF